MSYIDDIKKPWIIEKEELWIKVRSPEYKKYFTDSYGWKLHVYSSDVNEAKIILEKVIPFLAGTAVPTFKFSDYPKHFSNKLITIYFGKPRYSYQDNNNQLRIIAKEIDEIINEIQKKELVIDKILANKKIAEKEIKGDKLIPNSKSNRVFYTKDTNESLEYLKAEDQYNIRESYFNTELNPYNKEYKNDLFIAVTELKSPEELGNFLNIKKTINQDQEVEMNVNGGIIFGIPLSTEEYSRYLMIRVIPNIDSNQITRIKGKLEYFFITEKNNIVIDNNYKLIQKLIKNININLVFKVKGKNKIIVKNNCAQTLYHNAKI